MNDSMSDNTFAIMDVENDSIKSELFFLIAKFLKDSQFKNAFEALKLDLNESNILPTRIDFLGNENQQTFDELERKYNHIKSNHLLELCKRIELLSNYEKSPVPVVFSLLGKGSFSLVNTQKKRKYLSLADCITRQHNALPLPPIHIRGQNIVKVLFGREISGSVDKRYLLPVSNFANIKFHGRVLGHLTAVYCVCFDTSGRYIATGADDYLVKLWEANTGRLLSTLRGASAEITDIAINTQATLIAAGSMDKVLRVWCLQTARPIAHVVAHASMIVTVNFCPQTFNGLGYIASTSTDGSVVFWPFKTNNGNTIFELNLTVYNERMRPGSAKILCGAFSSGGVMFATGSADHNVRVYKMTPPSPDASAPVRLMEVEAHSDTVDSIQWAHSGLRFSSGSKDGTALIWTYKNQEWKYKTLYMTTILKKSFNEKKSDEELKQIKPSVTYLCWDQSDRWIITACTDMSIKVWDSYTTELLQVMTGHKKEVYVLESHPFHSKILLSAGHDGKIFLWNIITGEVLVSFQNSIEGQGFAALFDAKWSPDGTMFSVTDSQGHLLTYGLGIEFSRCRKVPYEVFFHTDYRPLLRAPDHSVLDEQTNIEPHLMPPPFLVDSDGSPYPPEVQKLVPGKENEGLSQLVADVIINELGRTEVIGIRGTANMNTVEHLSNNSPNQSRVISLHPSVEQNSSSFSFENRPRIICKPLKPSIMDQIKNRINMLGVMEEDEFTIESDKPLVVDEKPQVLSVKPKKKPLAKHSYSTRATNVEQEQENRSSSNSQISEEEDADYTDGIGSDGKVESSSDTDSGTSSEYSDWVADSGTNLEPPKRTQHRRRRVKKPTPPSSPSPPSSPQEGPKTVSPRKVQKDVPEIYRPSEWFSEVLPKKSPYCPQMGDILMFFEQGYNLYLEAVEAKKVYKLKKSQCTPWGELEIKEPQMVKVIGIKYEIRPPRLCGLRLAVLKENGDHTSYSFDLKYHDMQDVIDFLVLRQTYEAGLVRNWKEGQRFRSMIDNAWWCGKIVEQSTSRSTFLCYQVLWDNGEKENLSPWDMEPINPKREPLNGMSLPVTTKEIKDILYQPESGNKEWPSGSRDLICDRILKGLHDLMSMSLAEPFLAPVDIQEYPSYAYIVEYPIDLSIIKARLENRFYRRLAAVQFDARYVASNAEKFNEEGSDIVRSARIITEILLTIIKSSSPIEVPSLCRQLQQNYKNSEEEAKKNKPSVDRSRKLRPRSLKERSQRECKQSFNWKLECKKFLQMMWISKDSTPFREPINYDKYPDYGRVVSTPMDLTSIREDLRGDNYNTPLEFCEDVRRVFSNAQIYLEVHPDEEMEQITQNMIHLSEENISQILNDWKKRSSIRPTSTVSHLSSRPQRRCRLKRQRDIDNSPSEDESDIDFNLRTKRPRKLKTIAIKEETTDQSSDEDEIKFDPNQPSTSFAHNERNGSNRIKRKKSLDMPSTSREIKEEFQSDDETPLRRHSSRICKPTYRLQDDNDESEDDDTLIQSQRSNRLVKPVLQDYDNDSDDEILPTKPSRSRRFPLCEEIFEVPPITSRKNSSRFHDEEDNEEEEQPTRARSTQSRFLNNEETDQKGTRNLRKKKRWNYAKMLDVSGISSEEEADDWKPTPTRKFNKKAVRHKSRGLKTKQKRNYTKNSDSTKSSSYEDDNDDDDDDDEENSVNIRVSVSSRGRIRKLTAEAKAHLFRR